MANGFGITPNLPQAGLGETDGGINNLLQNRLLLQYLSGAGAALSAGQPISTGLDPITQQVIGAKSKADLQRKYLRDLLGGNVPEGGKITMDDKGISLNLPKSALAGEGTDIGLGSLSTPPTTPTGTIPGQTATTQARQERLNVANPFVTSQPVQEDISVSELAGLTSQDVTQALQGALGAAAFEQKKPQDIANLAYKQTMIRESQARIAKMLEPEVAERPFPIEVPGVGQVTLKEWNALTNDDKAYAGYVNEQKRLDPNEPIISKREWLKETSEDEKLAYGRGLLKHPEVAEILRRQKAAGATRISLGEKLKYKKEVDKLKGQFYFSDPKWITDLDKHLTQSRIRQKIHSSENSEDALALEKGNWINKRIIGGGGKILGVKYSNGGKIAIWTVEWPSGDIGEVKHAVR